MSELAKAVTARDVAKVRELLASGADVNEAGGNGKTPLYIASYKGYIDIVILLLEAGADANKVDTGYGETPLYAASGHGRADIVALLLNAGANVDKARKNDGGSPLVIASYARRADIVRLLLEAGADVHKAKWDGETPLYIASYSGYADIVTLLLNAGADIYQPSYDGKSVLTYAQASEFDPDVTTLIRDRAARKVDASHVPLNTIKKPTNAPMKCFNPIMADEENVSNDMTVFYIAKEDGTIGKASCLDSDSLDTYKTSRDYIFYKCKDSVPVSALHITRNSILPDKLRLLNFDFRVYVKDSQAQKLQSGKKYILYPGEDVGRIVSQNVLDGGSVVSAVHCGPSDGSKLYTIKEVDETLGGGRRTKRNRRSGKTRKCKKARKPTKRRRV